MRCLYIWGDSLKFNHFGENHLTPHNDSVVVIFFFCKVQASVTYCTHLIQVISD